MKTKKNLVKRALSLVLTLLMVLSLVPMSVFSTSAAIWECTHPEYANGFCTLCGVFEPATLNEDGVYEIGNAGQLYWFADQVNYDNANFGSANAVLTADIVVNENVYNEDGTFNTNAREWTPIGDSSYRYSGIFDGQNHSVSGLYILGFSIDYVGLFGYADNATVKNTGVIDSLIMGNGCVGGVCGQALASKVINCYNSGAIYGAQYIGGVVGDIDDSTITNCYNTGTVSGVSEVGGVSGNAYASKVINCYNTGEVKGGLNVVGGVVGYNDGGGTITNCYNTGTVSGSRYVGGVVGRNYDATITNCYNTGEVSGSLNVVGGVVGDNYDSTVTNCYNTGAVSGGNKAGGVVGVNHVGTITNCYNTGYVSRTTNGGGVVGENEGGTVTNCYYSDLAYAGGSDGKDTTGSAEAKITEQFESGEVAYLLGEAFGQKLGEDMLPVLGGDKVYFGYTDCKATEKIYTNTEAYDEKPSHSWDNGFCTVCDAFEPAKYNNNCSTDDESDDFYEISNAGQLYWFADKVNNDNANFGSANAVLTADIVVNEGVMDENSTGVRAWTPIGNDSTPYTGTFDGNGKTVSGLYFNNSEASFVGLFGGVGTNGTVKNIGVINSYFNGYDYVGGVAGYSFESTITNCYNTGTVSGKNRVGGVVGVNLAGTTTDCYNTGTVSGEQFVGGVAGENYDSTITNCYNTGTVSGEDYVGGVAGYNYYTTVTNCYYSDTAYAGGIDGEDITGSAEAKTTEQFESGEVAYLLGEAFGQKIGEDDTPVLGGDKVYFGYENCEDDAKKIYTNTEAYDEKPSHSWDNGVCTVCDKVCVHTGGTATCTKPAVCEICGAEYGDLDVNNHVGESTPEFNWFAPSYGSCYVDINLICDDCGNSVAYDYDYASVAESAEGTDCLHPGYELYEITFEIDGTSYTDSYKHILKSDNHVGEFENGFCSVCGGFEPAYFNEEEWVYEIGNAGQLYWYAQKLNEENAEMSVVLTEDIVIPEDAPNWEPITASYVTFDGQFHTISGINSVHENYTYVGMFGNEVWWYEIKNLHLTDSNFEGPDYVGGLVASMNNGGTVQNCYVTNTTVKGGNGTGTLVGFLGMSNVINCYVDTDTLVGDFNGYGSIENSYYLAEVETEDGGKTLEQFKSGEVAYLLQAGIPGEDIYDDDWNYIETIIPEIWGQTIGKEDYPVLGGEKVYLSDEGYYNKANKLAGYTISLGDKIAVNYYMSLTEKTINDANAKMVFTVPDTGSTYTVEIPVSEAVKSGDYYVFTCEVAAKEMTSVIKAKFVTSDTELQLEDYSVQQYAEVILSDTVKYAKEQELVKAMLNYGAYAQICFGYNTESLANSILDEADKALATYSFDEFAPVVSGEEAGVTYYGSTLSLKSETAIKHYFIIEDESSMPEFKVNGNTVEAVKNGTLYEVKITDLPAHNLDEVFTVEAGALSVQYGAFSYAYQALQTDKDALKDVVNALYTYNLKADEYVVSDSID